MYAAFASKALRSPGCRHRPPAEKKGQPEILVDPIMRWLRTRRPAGTGHVRDFACSIRPTRSAMRTSRATASARVNGLSGRNVPSGYPMNQAHLLQRRYRRPRPGRNRFVIRKARRRILFPGRNAQHPRQQHLRLHGRIDDHGRHQRGSRRPHTGRSPWRRRPWRTKSPRLQSLGLLLSGIVPSLRGQPLTCNPPMTGTGGSPPPLRRGWHTHPAPAGSALSR